MRIALRSIASVALTIAALTHVSSQSFIPEETNKLVQVKPVVNVQAYPFQLGEVQLLKSPFFDAMEVDKKYLLEIEPDRLLSQFRAHSGLKPKAAKYGGWEDSGLAGHTLGHYLSACAMEYAVSKDRRFLDRVNYIVDELDECQRARKTGYVGAIPREDSVFMEVSKGEIKSRGFDLNGAWSPWYTIHKVMAGLLDSYLYCNNSKALKIEQGISDWTGEVLKNLTEEQLQKMLLCEYGGMNEVLVNTYAFTGNKKYLDLSYKFHDKFILDSLAVGKDILSGKHSNTQVPKTIGTVRRYELTGNKKDLDIAEFFWKTVVEHHTYAPGGNSNYEYLGDRDRLNDKLTDNTMETCNTYNMLKLTRHLFALQPRASLMDFYERALYNHILASQNRKDGMMCYFVPLRMGTQKEFSDKFNTFTCCVGSGMENHVKYGESIYFKGKDGSLFVNLFIPSKLNWKQKGVQLTLTSDISSDSKVVLTFEAAKGEQFALKIRKPYWSLDQIDVTVNGKKESVTLDNGYFVLSRKWKKGDVVVIEIPTGFHKMSMPDNPSRQAFFFGPVLLAGNLGTTEPDPMTGIPVIVSPEVNLNKWFQKEGSVGLAFQTRNIGQPSDVKLQPFYELDDEFYTVYWDVFSPEQWTVEQKRYEEKKKAEYALEKITVDHLRVGEMQPERDHFFTGDNLDKGESHTRTYRIANEGGFFKFKVTVVPGLTHKLIATYWGMDNRGRRFEILVDGTKIASEDLNKFKESKFYDISYEIPASMTEGKTSVEVMFKPEAHNQAGPVYGIRVVTEERVDD